MRMRMRMRMLSELRVVVILPIGLRRDYYTRSLQKSDR
jgi:hypothetical protein